ncbi:hypothetical protein SAPIO_CDS2785 [Scedosporium apiospermum]|uniref:Bifunctional polynucleotide phosphatase/kinase n=1 Tax=Pseudallescheria apiosperma TaxID=563466 RepID=A0A084GBJ0_PSEDA|nr:uncharacterized protein SAPIO_CDS2785 [Scedosporium apiospermum]KEZ44702.1 hypothetical protein SAPIO_CDS2785 [Scedosporium apiospermum]
MSSTGPSNTSKRGPDAPVSPPPLKRRLQSGTTKSAVANFFTPTSQKPKDKTIWTERAPDDDTPATLLVGRYQPDKKEAEPLSKRRKIAAFDLDSTLIVPASGKKHADSAADWKWWHNTVPTKLKALYEDDGYRVIIISNQGGLKLHHDPKSKAPKSHSTTRVTAFKQKCSAVLSHLDIPTTVYAATGKDLYRKPRTGMWTEMCDDYDLTPQDIDLEHSFFVGDAGGRIADVKGGDKILATVKDFSCSDRNFAHNIGLPFLTPEEFFLGLQPRDFHREFDLAHFPFPEEAAEDMPMFEKKNKLDLVVFCGPPGAGKSTFYQRYLEPLGYRRVNQDTLKTRDKCVQAAQNLLGEGDSVVIDNTNPDPDTRAVWVGLAKKFKVPVRCVWFKTPPHICEHNDAMNPERREALPKLAFNSFMSRFKQPQEKEGFEDIVEVEFRFRGTKDEHEIWARYWL